MNKCFSSCIFGVSLKFQLYFILTVILLTKKKKEVTIDKKKVMKYANLIKMQF